MEEIIKKLIEVDKRAREKVEKANARKADVVGEIDKKRNEMKKDIELEFKERSEQSNLQAIQAFESEYSEEKIKAKENEATQKLDSIYEQNRERWVAEIFRLVTEN